MSLTSIIPNEFLEIDNYDHFNRLLVGVYIRQEDHTFIRGRLAHIRSGNVFKMVNPIEGEDDNTISTLYRAYKDAMYDNKQHQVIIHCTTLEDYEKETNLKEYEFEPPDDDPCRKKFY